jgi:4'-phosphopantetheinyl transferase
MAAIAESRPSSHRRLPTAHDVHVVAVDLDVEPGDERCLSEDELERAAGFHFERDRRRFVAGRSLLRERLAQYLDATPAELAFAYGPHGKPSLPGSGISFNVSNSGHVGLFGFTSGLELGVDVELLAHARPDDDAVAARFFSTAEVATLRACPPTARAHAFLRCWTRKEAFIKGRGEGLSLPLQDFDVEFAAGEPPALLRTAWSSREPADWTLCDLSDLVPGAVAALAARAPEIRVVRCDEINEKDRKERQ